MWLDGVLEWHRRGYLRSSGWFSCAWTRDGERLASINVQAQRDAVTLKYQSRSYGEDWSDVEQRVAIAWTPCRFGGEQPWFVCSVPIDRWPDGLCGTAAPPIVPARLTANVGGQ